MPTNIYHYRLADKCSPNNPTVTLRLPVLRRGCAIATVARARKLAVRLFWMWRKGQHYQQVKKFGSDTGQLEVSKGVKSITVKVIERPVPPMA